MEKKIERFSLWNENLPEGIEIIFLAEGLEEAKETVIKFFPQYYYGCNINSLDSGDFSCIPVKRFFEERLKDYGTPMPV